MADELGFKIKGAASDPVEVCAFNTRVARRYESRRRVTKTIATVAARNPDPEEWTRRLEKIMQEQQQATDKRKANEAAPDSTSDSPSAEPSSKEAEPTTEEDAADDLEEGETEEDTHDQQVQKYRWCKCFVDPAQFGGRDHYYLQMDTQESRWDEPKEPYWLWDAEKQELDPVGLQQSSTQPTPKQPDPEYYGYNPKIHGTYDPNAPYAQYHNQKREEEAMAAAGIHAPVPSSDSAYSVAGTFNRFTGNFQSGEQSAERHNDYNKSGRQMSAYYDVDAAANSHNGKSLKEERRNEKLSKQQIRELADKRRAKKEKKRMDFYKS